MRQGLGRCAQCKRMKSTAWCASLDRALCSECLATVLDKIFEKRRMRDLARAESEKKQLHMQFEKEDQATGLREAMRALGL